MGLGLGLGLGSGSGLGLTLTWKAPILLFFAAARSASTIEIDISGKPIE